MNLKSKVIERKVQIPFQIPKFSIKQCLFFCFFLLVSYMKMFLQRNTPVTWPFFCHNTLTATAYQLILYNIVNKFPFISFIHETIYILPVLLGFLMTFPCHTKVRDPPQVEHPQPGSNPEPCMDVSCLVLVAHSFNQTSSKFNQPNVHLYMFLLCFQIFVHI